MVTSDVAGTDRAQVQRPLAWVDVARVAAILAVIAIHVVSPLVTNRALPESWWFGNVVDSAARWSVPAFVMISGALLLHSDHADQPAFFYRRRLSRILPPLVAWTATYLFVGHITTNNPRTLTDAFKLILAGRPFFHLYFLYLIAGLYLVAPFLRPLVTLPNRRILAVAVLVTLALGIADLAIQVWGGSGGVNAATRFVPYVGYFLAGAWFMGIPPTRRRIAAAASVAAVGIVVTIGGTGLLVDRFGLGQGRYLYEYLSVTSVPVSLGVFALFLWSSPALDRMAARLPPRWLSTIAAATLGIYVVHPLVMAGLNWLGLNVRAFPVPLAVPTIILATFVASLAIVLALRMLPGIRRLV